MRVSTLAEWRACWIALPVLLRRICLVIVSVFGCATVLCSLFIVWEFKCDIPNGSVQRVLVPVVRMTVDRELSTRGNLGDIDGELRSSSWHPVGLDTHRIVVEHVGTGYDVVIRPNAWCFCRSTFILHGDGRKLEIRQSFRGR